jgi:hypothetical protein
MDVIGSLYVSLGSSTVQHYDSLGSRHACTCSEAGFSSENGDRAWGVYNQRTAFCCAFFFREDSMQRVFIKKCFLFMVGCLCRVKRFTTGSINSLKDVRKSQVMPEQAETTIKRLQCCRFWHTGKAVRQVYQCWWSICREINVFSKFEYHMFYVLYPYLTYLLTLPCICVHIFFFDWLSFFTFSVAGCIASVVWWQINDEFERTWMEVVIT